MPTKLTGRAAYQYALELGVDLHKYSDPTEGAREYDMTEHEDAAAALAVLAEDPSLLWVEVL